MNFLNPDPTFHHQADRVYALYQQIADIRDRHSVTEADTRRVSLNNTMMAANAATATLRLLGWAKQGGNDLLIQALGLSKPEYINPVAEDLLRANRLFLLLESQFQIETAFRNILAALGKPTSKQGFYNVVQAILAGTGIPDAQTKARILNVAAMMRNSMHSNGIHHGWNGTNTVEIIQGLEFRFEHGKRVQCGSWHHITTALSASFDIVGEMFASGSVMALQYIPDIYAEQKAANP
jgi:hypothetical protein